MNAKGHSEHSVIKEGIITGLIGAGIVAVWFLILDSAAGRPLQTPNALGKIIFRGDLAPDAREILPHIVLGYTVVHLVIFAAVGMILALLANLTTKNISLRMGVWMGLVIAFAFFAGVMMVFSMITGERLSLWSVLVGNLVGIVGMRMYLWHRYPSLGKSFDRAPLGSEIKPPPHPPEVS